MDVRTSGGADGGAADVPCGLRSPEALGPMVVPYGLPPERCMTSFNASARFRPTSRLEYTWTSLVVGGTPELVVFSDACDAAVGSAVWDVYPAR
mgnify:CR=1 FL=1